MICVLYNNTQKNARKNTKKDRKNPKKYIISMNNAFNNLCEVSNSRDIKVLEEKYKVQLELYKKALEEATRKKVTRAMIWSLNI